MFIGVTGTNASGKTEVVKHLKDEGYKAHSLSDILREEAKERQLEPTVKNLVDLGNELREKQGADILARKTADKFFTTADIQRIKLLKYDDVNKYGVERAKLNQSAIIESIRNPAEVKTLKQRLQRDFSEIEITTAFYLIAVDAPLETRHIRFNLRKRAGENVDLDKFKEMDALSLGLNQPETGQQLKAVLEMADYNINNNGTENELIEKVEYTIKAAKQYKKDLYYMNLVFQSSSRADCRRRMLGAVRVNNDIVLRSGYNGSPRGVKNCNLGGCKRCADDSLPSGADLHKCSCIHAEANAIKGTIVEGATLYTMLYPCRPCAKEILNSGISRIVYAGGYASDAAELFEQVNRRKIVVKIEHLKL